MIQAAPEQSDWQAVIEAHRLESHQPQEWLHYGMALLQTLQPGPEATQQQQQAALAFEQAKQHGAMAQVVKEALWKCVRMNVLDALIACEMTQQRDDSHRIST
jgi:hypothetical protein